MKEQFNTGLPDPLEQLSTQQLDAMLRSELEKEPPDEHTLRRILKILRDRESDYPVMTNERVDAAWKRYRKKMYPAAHGFRKPLQRVAAILILCSLFLFAMPQEAAAASLFDRIAAWTENVFSLFSPSDRDNAPKEYVYRTDHPGLQQLYDTVTGLGVTVPVVPMWLDLEYEYLDCLVTTTPITTKARASFAGGDKEAIFEVNIYSGNIPREFHKDDQQAEKYERNGIIHYIFENSGSWTIVWTRENLECFITIACPEDDVYHIIDSIYTMEE